MPLTTVAVLFTDVVGSTELMSRVGENVADDLRRDHFERLRRVIAANDGREVKNLGDGLMVVFDSAASALSCAAGMQQALAAASVSPDRPERIQIRIGVSFGEVEAEDDDYFGAPVVEAARLCAAAGTDEILVADMVRLLVRSRGNFDLEPAGALELKGLAEPVEASRLRWDPTPPVAAPSLPTALSSLRSGVFVGRTAERSVLNDALKLARGGERRAVLISGEPGLGKSTLVATFAEDAASDGATVVYGRCDEDLRIPYQPWAELLTDLARRSAPEIIADHLAAQGPAVGRLVPGIDGTSASSQPTRDDVDERHLMFVAVVDLLKRASRDQPIVVVLDDLHWADPGTVQLLRWVLTSSLQAQLLVVGTFRDSDIDADHPLSSLLADLHRRPGVDRVPLSGLGDDDVLALLEKLAGHEMTNAGLRLRDALLSETGGNPFFLGEMLRHLNDSGAIRQDGDGRWVPGPDFMAVGLPVSIREVIGRRVRWLGAETHRVLSLASVIGRDFDVDVLAHLADVDENSLVDLCDTAVAAAVLRPSERLDGYAFAHALIERTLYDELTPMRRARTHRKIAEAIEALCGSDPGRRVGELAHHWREAMQPADTAKAVAYARLAGDRALASLAATDAARWYRDALGLMTDGDRRSRSGCELLIALATAEREAGTHTFQDRVHDAGRLALELGADDLVVRAALVLRPFNDHFGVVYPESIALVEAALDRVGDDDSAERAGILVRLVAQTLHAARRTDVRTDAAQAAIDMANRLADLNVLADALRALDEVAPIERGSHPWYELEQSTCDQLRAAGDVRREVEIQHVLAHSALVLADHARFESAAARVEEIGRHVQTPFVLGRVAAVSLWRATLHGVPDDLEPTVLTWHERVSAIGERRGAGAGGAMSFMVSYLMRGRLAEVFDTIEETARTRAHQPITSAIHIWALALLGRIDEARSLLTCVDDERLTNGYTRITTWTLLADAAGRCGDPNASRFYLDLLRPCRGMIASPRMPPLYAVAHAMGLARACVGDIDAAVADLEHAVEVHERFRAPFHIAFSQAALADVLVQRDAPGDHDRARRTATAALEVGREHSYGYVIRDATAALDRLA